MTYDKVGVYVYEITEDDLDSSYVGYSKDNTVYTFTVTVTDNDSVLSAKTKLTKGNAEVGAAEFVNDYTPVIAELVPPVAVKEIVGKTPMKHSACSHLSFLLLREKMPISLCLRRRQLL